MEEHRIGISGAFSFAKKRGPYGIYTKNNILSAVRKKSRHARWAFNNEHFCGM
nr:MAG TPA: hypothetical protein [Caudoviricetes sp.]